MNRIEYKSRVDKSAWPRRGPWDREPDKIQWKDEVTSLPCLIVRNSSGALCGYVGVPNTHPLHGKDFDDVQDLKVHGGLTFSRGCADMSRARWAKWREGLFARRDEAKRFPHGETARYFKEWASALEDYDAWLAQGYASYICHVPGEGEPDDVWWFGFDCAHASDFCPGYQRVTEECLRQISSIELDQPTSWGTVVEYRDVAYVTEQCQLLAKQLEALNPKQRPVT